MKKVYLCLSFTLAAFSAFNAYADKGDKGSTYIMANVGMAEKKLKKTLSASIPAIGYKDSSSVNKAKYSPAIDIGAGYYLFDSLRADISIYYNKAKRTDKFVIKDPNGGPKPATFNVPSHTKSLGLFLNATYEITRIKDVIPFISAGAGIIQETQKFGKEEVLENKSAVGALQAGAGLQYNFDNGADWVVGYRYIKLKKREISNTSEEDGIKNIFKTELQPIQSVYTGIKMKF